MDDRGPGSGQDNTWWVLGVILVLLGVVFLVVQLLGGLGIQLGHYLWPLFVLVPGALLFVSGVASRLAASEQRATAGAMITMTGLILFVQNLTGLWASWAYAWALIAPTGIGLGQMAYGLVAGQPAKVSAGTRGAAVGLMIFVVAGVFFELVIGIDGIRLGLASWVWPLLLILLGVVLLLSRLAPRRIRR